jgi:hypothetical protein
MYSTLAASVGATAFDMLSAATFWLVAVFDARR